MPVLSSYITSSVGVILLYLHVDYYSAIFGSDFCFFGCLAHRALCNQ